MDGRIERELPATRPDESDAEFALAWRRDVRPAPFYPDMGVLLEVPIDGGLLAVVKRRADSL
jgi:hypothetical protein